MANKYKIQLTTKEGQTLKGTKKAKTEIAAYEMFLMEHGIFEENVATKEITTVNNKNKKGGTKMAENKREMIITIKDLEAEFNIPGRKIRVICRKNNLKPQPKKTEGFGPKAKYEWSQGSPELKKLVELLELLYA